MISHETNIRVRYGETDQMGYVYYGKYAEYFEVGRVELIRSLGLSYKSIEEQGIWMPVSELSIKYHRPGRYDDLLCVRTILKELPRSSFLTTYIVQNEAGHQLVTGSVKLAFLDAEKMIPVRVPKFILDAVSSHWPEKI